MIYVHVITFLNFKSCPEQLAILLTWMVLTFLQAIPKSRLIPEGQIPLSVYEMSTHLMWADSDPTVSYSQPPVTSHAAGHTTYT